VLEGQVRRANGGLYYRTAREFAAALDYLLHNGTGRDMLGCQGRRYIDQEYRWSTVIARVEALLSDVQLHRH
jgi:glycosyltransferase involved in cell wall biosynthesis